LDQSGPTATLLVKYCIASFMHRVIRWVAYAFLVWLIVNALAYPFSYLVPKGGTLLQNFELILLIEFVIVVIFADIFYLKHVRHPTNGRVISGKPSQQGWIGTVVEFDYPLYITAIFIVIQLVLIYMIAF